MSVKYLLQNTFPCNQMDTSSVVFPQEQINEKLDEMQISYDVDIPTDNMLITDESDDLGGKVRGLKEIDLN